MKFDVLDVLFTAFDELVAITTKAITDINIELSRLGIETEQHFKTYLKSLEWEKAARTAWEEQKRLEALIRVRVTEMRRRGLEIERLREEIERLRARMGSTDGLDPGARPVAPHLLRTDWRR